MLMSIIKDRMFTLYKRAIPEKKVKSRKMSPQIKKRRDCPKMSVNKNPMVAN